MLRQNKLAVIGAFAFTVLTAMAGTNSAVVIDDQLDMVENYGKYVGYVSGCAASTTLQNRFSSDIVTSFVVTLGAGGKSAYTRAVAQGRSNGIRIAKESPETCPEKLFAAGKLWQSNGLVVSAAARDPAKLPARFSSRIKTLSELTAEIGWKVYPALNTCVGPVMATDLKGELRALQFKHIWGPDTSKHPKPDFFDIAPEYIYTGDNRSWTKVAKEKCADALVFAGAYFKLLEQADDSDNSTPETRYVLRRAFGQR